MTPSAARRSTSATRSPKGRLISWPRTDGTMQKAQELSQPIWMVTQAEWSTSRRAGSADGNDSASSTASSRSRRPGRSLAGLRAAARRPGARCGCRTPRRRGRPAARMRSRSFWARQPPTTICRSGRGVLHGLEVAELAVELVVGVLPDAAGVEHDDVGVVLRVVGGTRPSASSSPAMRSESCSFIWHP